MGFLSQRWPVAGENNSNWLPGGSAALKLLRFPGTPHEYEQLQQQHEPSHVRLLARRDVTQPSPNGGVGGRGGMVR